MPDNDRRPIRILHVFHGMNPGGAETLVMNVYRHIDRARVQFDFAVHTDQRSHYDAEIEALGGRIFALPDLSQRPGLSGLRAYAQALSRVLHEHGPFAGVHSHVHYFSGVVLRLAEAAGVPSRLAHSHTTHDGETSSLGRKLYCWSMRYLLLRHTTHLLGCSRAACQGLYGRASRLDSRIRVLPNAIDLLSYSRPSDDRGILRRQLSLPVDAPLIGHVGRFTPVKNHRLLIDAFAALLVESPDARLVLVGDGPLRSDVEVSIREKDIERRVHLLGIRSDVPAILSALDVFVFPSLYEGLGMALIEAQAAGVPCVVSNAVPAEADLNLGLVRFLNPQAGVGEWARCILSARTARRLSWADRQRALQSSGYDVRSLAQEMERVYIGHRAPLRPRNLRETQVMTG